MRLNKLFFTKAFEASQQGRPLNGHEILDLYEESLPYGTFDPEEVEQRLKGLTQQKQKQKSEISVSGFLDYIRYGDEEPEEQSQEIQQQIQITNSIPSYLGKRP